MPEVSYMASVEALRKHPNQECWQWRAISLSFMDPITVLQIIQITGIHQGPAIPYAKAHLIILWKWVSFTGSILDHCLKLLKACTE